MLAKFHLAGIFMLASTIIWHTIVDAILVFFTDTSLVIF